MEHKILYRFPLGNEKRVWKQDNFVLSSFQGKGLNKRNAVENWKESGLTCVELGWADHDEAWEVVRLCEEVGLDLIFQDFSEFGGMQEWHRDDVRSDTMAKDIADKIRPWKRTIGYYVWDEPYKDDQLEETRRQIDMIEKEDPERLGFTVAIPSYNGVYTWENGLFADYLRRYADVIEPAILSLDYYPIGIEGWEKDLQLDNSRMWLDLEMMRKVCREKKLPLWFYFQSYDLHKRGSGFIFPMARMMMYAACLYGAKALQNFTAPSSITDMLGNKGQYFYEFKIINHEFSKLGNTLMALDNKFVFHSSDLLAQPLDTYKEGLSEDKISDSTILDGTLPVRTSVGELHDEYGNKYLFILNRDYLRRSDITLSLKGKNRLYLVDRTDGKQKIHAENAVSLSVHLEAGDACLFRVQPMTEEAFTLEYRLEKNI